MSTTKDGDDDRWSRDDNGSEDDCHKTTTMTAEDGVVVVYTDTAEAEQQYEAIDSDASDIDSEDDVRNQRQPLAAASRPEASASVDRFRHSEDAKCLAELYMATKGQSLPNSDSQRKQRQAFLSLPHNDDNLAWEEVG